MAIDEEISVEPNGFGWSLVDEKFWFADECLLCGPNGRLVINLPDVSPPSYAFKKPKPSAQAIAAVEEKRAVLRSRRQFAEADALRDFLACFGAIFSDRRVTNG